MNMRRLGKQFRSITAQTPTKVDDRTRRFKLSDSSVALDGHTLETSGWDLERAKRNLPVLFGHDADNVASMLGQWRNIHVSGDDLLGDAAFMDGSVNLMAETVLQMIDGGWLRAASVGFIPIEGKASKRGPGCYDFSKQMLVEASVVPVGSLATALVSARSAGIDLAPLAAWAERALDEGKSNMSTAELRTLRRAAGGPLPKVHAMPRADGPIFGSFGEQMKAIVNFRAGGVEDRRLIRAPAGAGEIDPGSGGFLVPTVISEKLVGSIYENAVVAQLVSRTTSDGSLASIKVPAVDETSRADGSRWGGAASYWSAEAATVSACYPRFRQIEFSTKKIISLGPVIN